MHTVKARSIGTVSSSVSYILRFLQAVFRIIRRKVVRSIAQSDPCDIALIVVEKVRFWKSFPQVFTIKLLLELLRRVAYCTLKLILQNYRHLHIGPPVELALHPMPRKYERLP